MSAPEQLLREAMSRAGLEPPNTIVWDRQVHRFPAPGEKESRANKGASWYRAFEDRKGAVFGCWKTGVKDSWYDRDSLPDDPDELKAARQRWRRENERIEEERRQEAEKVAEQAVDLWNQAREPDALHPYLRAKGVTEPVGIRQHGQMLLVPLRSMHRGSHIRSLQRIYPDGTKLYLEGGEVEGCRTTLNSRSFLPEGTIYLCEGWATAQAIHQVTGEPTVVAFQASNLPAVAAELHKRYAPKFPHLRFVLAADNDRWSKCWLDGREGANPGLRWAHRAARDTRWEIATPDFSDLDDRPTDFMDLLQAEGAEAVRYWLNPSHFHRARTTEDSEDPYQGPEGEPEPEPTFEEEVEDPEPRSLPDWLNRAPFRILGHNRGTYFFIPSGSGQIVALSGPSVERKANLFSLAPLSYWEHCFPHRNGVSWTTASDALIQAALEQGVFSPDRIRGRGCWPEERTDGDRGTLVHLGDRMAVPGLTRWVAPDDYESPTGYTYEVQAALRGPAKEPASLEETRDLLGLFESMLWHEPVSGRMLAGWTLLAPVCGALDWRPHIWVVGERGSGKTTLARDLVVPLLSGLGLYVVGETTEAGIRHELSADARPVVFDEAEETEGVGSRIQRVLALARQASSESDARTLKGTPSGSTLQFRVRSMFCFVSITGAVVQESDKSRISQLQLKGASQVPASTRAAHWQKVQPRLAAVTDQTGRRLFARTLGLLRSGVLQETVRIFRVAAGSALGDQRKGDQYGTLYAGSYLMEHSEPPALEVAREMMASEDISGYDEDARPEGMKALDIILQQHERVDTREGTKTMTIGELVAYASGLRTHGHLEAVDAGKQLGRYGLKVEGDHVLVANSGEWLTQVLRGTPYQRGPRSVLRTLEGVEGAEKAVYFGPGFIARASAVPIAYVAEGWEG